MTTPRAAGLDRPEDVQEGAELDAVLDGIREQFGETAVIQLSRQDVKQPTNWPYVGEVSPADFSLESIKQEYGPGKYRGRTMQNRRYVKGGHFTFSIAGEVERGAVAGRIAGPSADVSALRETVDKLAATVGTLAAAVASGAAGPRGGMDPLDMMDKVAGIMQKLTPAASPQAGIGQLLDVFKEGVKIATTVQGAAAVEGDSMAPMLRTLQPLVGVIAKNAELEIERKRHASAPAALPSPAPAPAPAPVTVTSPDIGPAWARDVRPHVSQLLLLASAGADPANWAPAVLDMIPDAAFPAVAELSKAPDFADQVLQALPELRAQEPWSRRMCAELAAILAEQDDGEDDDAPAATGLG